MKIKFKLFEEKLTNQGLELQVSECFYENQIVDKITLKSIHKFLAKNEDSKFFIIKDIQSNEIESKPNTNELIIDSPDSIIFPVKTDFLFAVNKIKEVNNNWEIELSFPHAWNGEKITKIRLIDADDQAKRTIEERKDEYFFTISGIKRYEFLLAGDGTKMLVLSTKNFQNLAESVLLHPKSMEVFVKNPKNNNNHYLIKCQGDLAKIGLKNYKKIRIVYQEKINDGDTIKFNLVNLKEILQRDEEDDILRIDNDYRSFNKIPTVSDVSPQQQAQRNIQEQIQKFLKKHQQKWKVDLWQKKLEKYFLLLQPLHDKFNDHTSKELIDQKNNLSQKLAEFASPTQLENRIDSLERQIFSTLLSYQNQDKIDQFKQELADIDQEFMELTDKVGKYQISFEEYLKKKATSIGENDSHFQQILAKYKISQETLFANLTGDEDFFWLQEDGSIDYSALENHLQEQSSQDRLSNNLGYSPRNLKDNRYKKWIAAQIKKKEADEANRLGYSLEKWKDSQYQEYKNTQRILADGMIEFLQRAWNPPLSEEHQEKIKSSWDSVELADNILRVQEKRLLTTAKNYFKDFVNRELKKSPPVKIDELSNYSTYAQEIDEKGDWRQLKEYLTEITSKISQVRKNKITSLSEAQKQAKKNINETFQKTKIKGQEFHRQHQNWPTKIKKTESIDEVVDFEMGFTLFLEEISYFSHQQWFPSFGKREKNQIKRAKDEKDLNELITTQKAKKIKWLIAQQINNHLRHYQELQEEEEQDYHSQSRPLDEVRKILERIDASPGLSLDSEQIELQKTLLKTLDTLEKLYTIKSQQQRFNEATSGKEKQEILQSIQKELQKITETRSLNATEAQIQKKVEQNLRLIQQGKDMKKSTPINERQTEFELLNLEAESPDENDSTTENANEQDWISQKSLIIFAITGLLLIFLWRWWRKKKEEEPFW